MNQQIKAMIKQVSTYHLLPIFFVGVLFFIKSMGTNSILICTVIFILLEIFVAIKYIKGVFKEEEKKYLYINILISIIHLLCGLLISYVNLAMNVGATSVF